MMKSKTLQQPLYWNTFARHLNIYVSDFKFKFVKSNVHNSLPDNSFPDNHI